GGNLDLVGPLPERRIRVVRDLALRLVADQQLEHHLARELGALAGALHLHALGRLADAGSGEDALALDLDHTGAAISVGTVARLGPPAQVRDFGAEPARHLPDRLPRLRLDLTPVEAKLDRIDHRALSFKRASAAG